MLKNIIAKKIRNFIGFFPSYFLIDFRKQNYSISDGFFWRTDKNFNTIFNFTDLLNLFYDVKNSNIEIIFFDRYGLYLKKVKINDLNNNHTLEINKKFMNNIEDYGTFYVFHNTNYKFNSIVRNSCYSGYSYKNNLPSFVHGNICSASKNLENNKIDFNIVGKSFFKKNTYIVQNHLNSKLNEIMLMNPTNKNLNITINDTNYDFLKWSTQLITIEKRIVKIKSNCYLIRPIIFSYDNDYLDVYHG